MTIVTLENLQVYHTLLKNVIDQIITEYENFDSFPKTGEPNRLYVDKSTNVLYYWNNQYVEFTDNSIVQKETYLSFPAVGNSHTIYIDTTENAIYRFSETDLKYYLVTSDWHNIKLIDTSF